MKSSLMAVLLFAVGGVRAADPTISIAATPRYPWNGKVDLKFTIAGTSGTKYDTSFTAKDLVGNTNLTFKTIYKSDGSVANVTKEQLLPGSYNWVWDAPTDLGAETMLEKVSLNVQAVEPILTYVVKFNANGGSGSMSSQTFNVGVSQALRKNTFKAPNVWYVFKGWATSSKATTAKYTDGQKVSNLTTAGGTIILYAVWKYQGPL